MNGTIILKDGEIKEDDCWLTICLYEEFYKICTGITYKKLWESGDRNKLVLSVIDDLRHGPRSC